MIYIQYYCIYAPSLYLKEAIYLHLPLVRKVFSKKSKTTIDYNNTLIKVQVSYITVVTENKTHSVRDQHAYTILEVLYYIYTLATYSINNCVLTEAGYYGNCSAVKRRFLKPPKPPSISP